MSWAEMGRQNLEAAEILLSRRLWRSSISRSYYSGMATSHALLSRFGLTPPPRGNWPNDALPAIAWHTLKAQRPRDQVWLAASKAHREELADVWAYRLMSDYAPKSGIGEQEARKAVKCARRLVKRMEMTV
jgi:hypothetical protein